MRYWLIDLPARAVDLAGRGYLLFIAALSILCLVNAALLLAWTVLRY